MYHGKKLCIIVLLIDILTFEPVGVCSEAASGRRGPMWGVAVAVDTANTLIDGFEVRLCKLGA